MLTSTHVRISVKFLVFSWLIPNRDFEWMAEVDVRPGENSTFAEKESRSLVPTLNNLC
jgi:hypothetical protein